MADNNITWSKIAQIAAPIILAALLASLVFFLNQIMGLRREIAELRLCEAERHGEVKTELGRMDIRLIGVEKKVDKLKEGI